VKVEESARRALCASWQAEREKAYGADKFSMRDKQYYHFTKPPKALLKARPGNIAIVPAMMLPFTKTLQQVLSTLPKGAVFLCHAEENTRQRKLLERVEETFREQGHMVMNLSMEEVYNNSLKF
jgi:hypothetical protein